MQGPSLRIFCLSCPCDGRFPVQEGLKLFKRFIVSEDNRNSESEHVIDVEDYNKMCLRKYVCEITLNLMRFRSSGDVLC